MLISELRKYKIGEFAIFDFVASYIVAILVWYLLTERNISTLTKILVSVVPLSIVSHLVFKVNTPLTDMFVSKTLSTSSILTKVVTAMSIYFIIRM